MTGVRKTGTLRILQIEDSPTDAELVRIALMQSGLDCEIRLATCYSEYLAALELGAPDLILSDSRGYDFEGLMVLRQVRLRFPDVPFLFLFLFLSGSYLGKDTAALMAEGAADCLLKDDLDALAPGIRRALERRR